MHRPFEPCSEAADRAGPPQKSGTAGYGVWLAFRPAREAHELRTLEIVISREKAAPVRTRAALRSRRNPTLLVGRDRAYVALHALRNYRRLQQENGDDHQASLRIPQLRKLPATCAGAMFLGSFGIGVCPRCWRTAQPV